jgi:4-amino-4-deoxy-L-arabinose transferase-like glycosyltransferase
MIIRVMKRSHTILFLVTLFLGGLILRIWARDWGLPYVEHPDEPAVLRVVVRMLRDDTLNPHTFIYPSLYYYLLAGTIRLYAAWTMAQGQLASLQDLPLQTDLYTTMPSLYIWGRSLTALLGAFAAPLLAILAYRMAGVRAAIIGGLLMMTCAYHIEHSHYVTIDATTSVMVIILLIGAWRIVEHGDWPAYLLAGVGVGLAAGVKYNAAAIALVVALAHVLRWKRAAFGRPMLQLLTAGAISIVVFLCTTPYALLDWHRFSSDLRFSAQNYATVDQGDFVGRWRLDGYLRFVWNQGLFPIGTIVLLLGLPFALRRWPRQMLLLIATITIHVFLLLLQMINFVRNILPIMPALLLLTTAAAIALADAIAAAVNRIRIGDRRWLRRLIPKPVLVTILCAGVLIGAQVRDAIGGLIYWSRPYTLVALAHELEAQPHGMRAAVETNPVQWSGNPVVFPVERITEHDAAWYRANGFRFLIVNNDHRKPDDQAAYQQLMQEARIIKSFADRDTGLQPGPGAALLDLGEHSDQIRFVAHPLRFGESIDLLGYELQPGMLRDRIDPLDGANQQVFSRAAALQINLYWYAHTSIPTDYTLFVHVLNLDGQQVAHRDLPLRAYDYRSSQWMPGEIVVDMADLPLPDLTAGTYCVEIGLYNAATSERLPTFSADGTQTNLLTTLKLR